MSEVVADTHAVVWFLQDSPRLSEQARAAMEQSLVDGLPILVSAVTPVEIIYLVEKGRIPEEVLDQFQQAATGPDAPLKVVAFDADMAQMLRTIRRDAIPDMPDRMIAATALFLDVPLITADQRIRTGGVTTIW